MWLYFDDNDRLKDKTFRQVTTIADSELVSYPLLIHQLAKENKLNIPSYTTRKLERLNHFIIETNKYTNETTN